MAAGPSVEIIAGQCFSDRNFLRRSLEDSPTLDGALLLLRSELVLISLLAAVLLCLLLSARSLRAPRI